MVEALRPSVYEVLSNILRAHRHEYLGHKADEIRSRYHWNSWYEPTSGDSRGGRHTAILEMTKEDLIAAIRVRTTQVQAHQRAIGFMGLLAARLLVGEKVRDKFSEVQLDDLYESTVVEFGS